MRVGIILWEIVSFIQTFFHAIIYDKAYEEDIKKEFGGKECSLYIK